MNVVKEMLGEIAGGGFAPSRIGYYFSQVGALVCALSRASPEANNPETRSMKDV